MFIALLVCAHPLIGGSILSSHGLGLPYDNPTVRAMGMGYAALANPSSSRIEHTNPAGLAYTRTTQLTIQGIFHQNRYKDPESNATSYYANFDGFHFAVPFGKGLTASFGLKPVTRVDYRIAFADQIESDAYTRSLKGSGGINRFAFAAAWTPANRVSIGVRASFLVGRIIEESRNRFESASDFTSSHDRISTYAHGFNWTAGLIVRPARAWTVGAVYSPSANLDTEIDLSQIFSTSSLRDGLIRYPSSYGIGISYLLRNRFLIAMDYQVIEWSGLHINETGLEETRNSPRIAFGVEKTPSTGPYAAYLKRIPLRLGFCYQPYYILDPNGEALSEFWATFGFGLPLFHDTSHLDFMIGLGRRGSLETNGLEENLIRFGVSITGGEQWFVRKY